ncbi:GNAT family N-acetyltransferase [Aliikangiella coralliicola]|uniref:GNAT family N-acetyltransferase n=1 Tax=Aliikangiella coralliicola TaxID=2592383 RepID=A0A545U4Y0_9GAMM|nr:GNAT family protein [Aliikangiella coralliicola]TQV84512.1 GNAT family N-acetyltransferase [Aliikangiella coralliicola]
MQTDIRSGELILKPVEESDEQLYMSLFQCSRTMKHVRFLSLTEISSNFNYIVNNSRELYFSIYREDLGKKLGLIGVSLDKKNEKSGELGVLLLPKVSPKGTAKIAMITLITHLFDSTDIDEVRYTVALDNKAAIRSCRSIYVDFSQSEFDSDPQIGCIKKSSWKLY